MKRVDLTVEQLRNIVAKNEVVGRGSFGIIYKLNDDTLFKFEYKDYFDDFEVKDGRVNLKKLLDISETIENRKKINRELNFKPSAEVEKIIKLQDKVHLTKLTQGLVYVNNHCVGYLLYYHKNMVNLFEYIKDNKINDKDKKQILENIKNAIQELCDNNIYMTDLTTHNILINPANNEIQLIDFEDSWTSVREEGAPEYIKNTVKREIKDIHNYIYDIDEDKEFFNNILKRKDVGLTK